MSHFKDILKGDDRRSIGMADQVVEHVNDQQTFDELFREFYNTDRMVVMRAADAIEKITLRKPDYLKTHKDDILMLCHRAEYIELKWHLALLVSRLDLTKKEAANVWNTLTNWVTDKKESKIVRVNALQGLYNILQSNKELTEDFRLILQEVERENIPSINARIRKLKNAGR
ncbi:hypothetical protein [Negadavirga shengliensis]|uniref:HEAT repeat domain-containing protein n=1 Tax=Negadavirga shengliensis TaxID=1389218 RepID=A0ABV9T3E8_9BACT